jgi:hypothetical protein
MELVREADILMIRTLCSAIAVISLLAASTQTAYADALLADGDGVTPVTGTRMDFGRICHGDPVSLDALVAVRATGHPHNRFVFEDGTIVHVSGAVLTGDGLSVSSGDPTLVMASDWRSQPNGTMTDPIPFTVVFTPSELGPFAGRIAFTANGTNRHGEAIARTDNLNVRARVDDCRGPVFAVAPDLVVEAAGPDGAEASFDWPTATDAVDGPVPVTCDLPAPAALPLGTTVVTCFAEDEAGNESTTAFSITVADTSPPNLDGPLTDLVVDHDGAEAVVAWDVPTAVDVVDGAVEVTCDPPPGSTFPPGGTEVACRAEDAAGNVVDARFVVTVSGAAPSEPIDDEGQSLDDNGAGPPVTELPDTAMADSRAPLPPIGVLLLAAAALALRRSPAPRRR